VLDLFELQNSMMLLLSLMLFGCKAFAFVDAATRPAALFVAAGKQTKQFWMLILGLATAVHMVFWNPIGILNIVGVVAAFVYLADTRPAMKALRR
jgi:asparagine N-glycosylation enzyme membrane subunit Stt3